VSTLAGLRRATAADVLQLIALQQAAYAKNREILGVEPLPLRANYAELVSTHEIWLLEGPTDLDAALILHPRPADLLIWSVATAPHARGRGLGRRLLAAAEERARALGLRTLRLYTGEKMTGNIAWYGRHGYAIERVEQLADRNAVHMTKMLAE
jgi:ribosomal protein S18 acetylase RimI-like enzyme